MNHICESYNNSENCSESDNMSAQIDDMLKKYLTTSSASTSTSTSTSTSITPTCMPNTCPVSISKCSDTSVTSTSCTSSSCKKSIVIKKCDKQKIIKLYNNLLALRKEIEKSN